MIRKQRKVGEDGQSSEISSIWEVETYVRKRIQWTAEREKELLRLTVMAKPSDIGYMNRLLYLWNSKYPDLKTTSTALYQRLSVLRNRGADADEPVVQPDHNLVEQMDVTEQVRMQR